MRIQLVLGATCIHGGDTPFTKEALQELEEAVEFFEPYGVDASSRLEDAPGVKNLELVRRFVSAAKGR